MDGDLIGLFALLVGLELILGVDNVLVIAILVSRLPKEKQNSTRNFGLILALVARILMVIGGLQLVQLTEPAFSSAPLWFQYSWRDFALLVVFHFHMVLIWLEATQKKLLYTLCLHQNFQKQHHQTF